MADVNGLLWPGEVTSVSRAGTILRWRPAWCDARDPGRPGADRPFDSPPWNVHLLPADLIEVRGALASAAVHAWPRRDTPGLPYESTDDLYAAFTPHLLSSPSAIALRDAALEREASITAVAAAARAVPAAPGGAGSPNQAGTAYRAAIAVCNARYRHALAAATRAPRPHVSGTEASMESGV